MHQHTPCTHLDTSHAIFRLISTCFTFFTVYFSPVIGISAGSIREPYFWPIRSWNIDKYWLGRTHCSSSGRGVYFQGGVFFRNNSGGSKTFSPHNLGQRFTLTYFQPFFSKTLSFGGEFDHLFAIFVKYSGGGPENLAGV